MPVPLLAIDHSRKTPASAPLRKRRGEDVQIWKHQFLLFFMVLWGAVEVSASAP